MNSPVVTPLGLGSAQHAPKDVSNGPSSTTPPPAYSPASQLGSRLLAHLQQLQAGAAPGQGIPSLVLGRPPLTTVVDELDDDDLDSQEGTSPICLRINTAVIVTKSNNLVCLTDTPANHANAIAKAVVQAIQENSSGRCGIPMIDEEGRPRPVKIEVDAGITVDGANNVVGNEEMIHKVLDARKRVREGEEEEEEETADEEGRNAMPKRQCRRT